MCSFCSQCSTHKGNYNLEIKYQNILEEGCIFVYISIMVFFNPVSFSKETKIYESKYRAFQYICHVIFYTKVIPFHYIVFNI